MDNNYCKSFQVYSTYILPFSRYDGSYELKTDFDTFCFSKNISQKKALDVYVKIGVKELDNIITKMILHDITVMKQKKNCIIDYYI